VSQVALRLGLSSKTTVDHSHFRAQPSWEALEENLRSIDCVVFTPEDGRDLNFPRRLDRFKYRGDSISHRWEEKKRVGTLKKVPQ